MHQRSFHESSFHYDGEQNATFRMLKPNSGNGGLEITRCALCSSLAGAIRNPTATSSKGRIVMTNPSSDRDNISDALIAVVRLRYQAFLERFGRDPGPDEPLLFDPKRDQPTAANADERLLQIRDAAEVAKVDAILLLNYFG